MISIRVSKKSLRDLNDKIRKLIARLQNPRPVLNDIADYMIQVTRSRLIETKRGPDGKRWADNSELTQYLKGRNDPNMDKGNLVRSIKVTRRDRWGFTISANVPYAGYVQDGVKIMKGRYQSKRKPIPQIPPRPFLGFSETNKHKIAEMLREYIRSGRDHMPDTSE